MVKVLIDINYSVCFIASGGWRSPSHAPSTWQHTAFLLTLLPLNCRLLQCLRRYRDDGRTIHLWNFSKYLTSLLAVVLGVWNPALSAADAGWSRARVLYIALLIASTAYSWVWDVFVDWGLYYRRDDGRWVARPIPITGRTLLPALDLIGRCAWAYTIVVDPPGERFGVAALVFFTAMVEVLRRSMWAVVRIAHEHHTNASNYRVVKEVPLGQLCLHPEASKPTEGQRGLGELLRWLADRPASPMSPAGTPWGKPKFPTPAAAPIPVPPPSPPKDRP
jgi:hypothetical protein